MRGKMRKVMQDKGHVKTMSKMEEGEKMHKVERTQDEGDEEGGGQEEDGDEGNWGKRRG